MLLELTSPSSLKLEKKLINPNDYIFLVEIIAHKFRKKLGGRFEKIQDTEVYSIASLELVKAAAGYDSSVGEDFSRYAFRSMKNGIIGAIRLRKAQKRTADFSKLSQHEWEEISEKEIPSKQSLFDLCESLVCENPTDTEQDCSDKLLLKEIYLEGKSVSTIAQKYKISRVTIYNRLNRIINKIRPSNFEGK